jgi:hypothetical protein
MFVASCIIPPSFDLALVTTILLSLLPPPSLRHDVCLVRILHHCNFAFLFILLLGHDLTIYADAQWRWYYILILYFSTHTVRLARNRMLACSTAYAHFTGGLENNFAHVALLHISFSGTHSNHDTLRHLFFLWWSWSLEIPPFLFCTIPVPFCGGETCSWWTNMFGDGETESRLHVSAATSLYSESQSEAKYYYLHESVFDNATAVHSRLLCFKCLATRVEAFQDRQTRDTTRCIIDHTRIDSSQVR